jgi:hypothetical protein
LHKQWGGESISHFSYLPIETEENKAPEGKPIPSQRLRDFVERRGREAPFYFTAQSKT